MKRHPDLRQLSREHHAALVLAKRIAACAADRAAVESMCLDVTRYVAAELLAHFDEEEATLLQRLRDRHGAEVRRIESDHAAMRSLASRIAQVDLGALRRFGQLLADHVHFEEREFFALVEPHLPFTPCQSTPPCGEPSP